MPDAILIGGGGHARVLLDIARRLGHRVVGYAAPTPAAADPGLPYLGDDDALARSLDAASAFAILALGKTHPGDHRLRVMASLARAGFRFPAIVAPSATVHADVVLSDGVVVLDGAVVATGTRLGRGCIVNTRASVDHDVRLGNDVHVAPGATLCGAVQVGDDCLIGAGATLIPEVRLVGGITVGAGAVVVRDLLEPGTYVGAPARKIR